jgi:hypothetical protein
VFLPQEKKSGDLLNVLENFKTYNRLLRKEFLYKKKTRDNNSCVFTEIDDTQSKKSQSLYLYHSARNKAK